MKYPIKYYISIVVVVNSTQVCKPEVALSDKPASASSNKGNLGFWSRLVLFGVFKYCIVELLKFIFNN